MLLYRVRSKYFTTLHYATTRNILSRYCGFVVVVVTAKNHPFFPFHVLRLDFCSLCVTDVFFLWWKIERNCENVCPRFCGHDCCMYLFLFYPPSFYACECVCAFVYVVVMELCIRQFKAHRARIPRKSNENIAHTRWWHVSVLTTTAANIDTIEHIHTHAHTLSQ